MGYRVRDGRGGNGDLPQRFYHCARAQSVNNNVADVVFFFLFLIRCVYIPPRRPTVNGCEQQLQQPADPYHHYYNIICLYRPLSAASRESTTVLYYVRFVCVRDQKFFARNIAGTKLFGSFERERLLPCAGEKGRILLFFD